MKLVRITQMTNSDSQLKVLSWLLSFIQFVFACLVAFALAAEITTYAAAPASYPYYAFRPVAYTQYSSPLTYTSQFKPPLAYAALGYNPVYSHVSPYYA